MTSFEPLTKTQNNNSIYFLMLSAKIGQTVAMKNTATKAKKDLFV